MSASTARRISGLPGKDPSQRPHLAPRRRCHDRQDRRRRSRPASEGGRCEARRNLAALKTIRHRLADAVRVAEQAASGKAISGGLIRERGRLNFAIVVMSGSDLKEVILEPPGASGRR